AIDFLSRQVSIGGSEAGNPYSMRNNPRTALPKHCISARVRAPLRADPGKPHRRHTMTRPRTWDDFELPEDLSGELPWPIRELVGLAWDRGYAEALRQLMDLPLTIRGGWEPDTVYDRSDAVFHGGRRWLAMSETSAEPGRSDLWIALDTDERIARQLE